MLKDFKKPEFDFNQRTRGCRSEVECKNCGYYNTISEKVGFINHDKKRIGIEGPCCCIGPEFCLNCKSRMRPDYSKEICHSLSNYIFTSRVCGCNWSISLCQKHMNELFNK